MNNLQKLESLVGEKVKITMLDGSEFICEPLQMVFDDELESYSVYIIDGLGKYESNRRDEVYTPDISNIEKIKT